MQISLVPNPLQDSAKISLKTAAAQKSFDKN